MVCPNILQMEPGHWDEDDGKVQSHIHHQKESLGHPDMPDVPNLYPWAQGLKRLN